LSRTSLFENEISGSATISPCGIYRYDLVRSWVTFNPALGRVTFLMLNPSKADATKPDPTMTRCLDFAKTWKFDSLSIINLFAFRSTKPEELRRAVNPVGPENDDFIRRHASLADLLVCAWGANPFAKNRINRVMEILSSVGVKPHCLQLTKEGHPSHPLFLLKTLKPFPMETKH